MPRLSVKTVSGGGSGTARSFTSFLLHSTDIIVNTSGKAFALSPSPSAYSGFSGRMPTVKVTGSTTLGYVQVSQLFWQSGAINAGTITVKCIVNGVADAATLAITSATANPVTSNAFNAIALTADQTLGFTADFSADLDATGLEALLLSVEIR